MTIFNEHRWTFLLAILMMILDFVYSADSFTTPTAKPTFIKDDTFVAITPNPSFAPSEAAILNSKNAGDFYTASGFISLVFAGIAFGLLQANKKLKKAIEFKERLHQDDETVNNKKDTKKDTKKNKKIVPKKSKIEV